MKSRKNFRRILKNTLFSKETPKGLLYPGGFLEGIIEELPDASSGGFLGESTVGLPKDTPDDSRHQNELLEETNS